jgi:DNA-binding IclR family transcriptional regulator
MWTAEEAAAALGVVVSSAYRIIAELTQAGLVDAIKPGRYVLGPAITELDRQIQLTDPLLQASRPIMAELITFAPEGSAVILSRAFRDKVLWAHVEVGAGHQRPFSYDRGRPLSLIRGAGPTIILAFAPLRTLKRLYAAHAEEIREVGLGGAWDEFLARLRTMRKAGYAVARAAYDPGRYAIAAPVLDEERRPLGSLCYILEEAKADDRTVKRLAAILVAAAHEVATEMRAEYVRTPAREWAAPRPKQIAEGEERSTKKSREVSSV